MTKKSKKITYVILLVISFIVLFGCITFASIPNIQNNPFSWSAWWIKLVIAGAALILGISLNGLTKNFGPYDEIIRSLKRVIKMLDNIEFDISKNNEEKDFIELNILRLNLDNAINIIEEEYMKNEEIVLKNAMQSLTKINQRVSPSTGYTEQQEEQDKQIIKAIITDITTLKIRKR